MKTVLWLISAMALVGLLILSLVLIVYLQLPNVNEIKNCPVAAISQRKLCPASGQYTPLSQISKNLKQAVLLSEDAAFYTHEGFDWHELEQSFWTNLEKGGYVRGGSTITQQLAKNVWLSGEKSLTRKLTEAFLASRLEKTLSKNEILEYYLNVIEWGPKVYGIKQASSYYFRKSPSELTPAESSYLAFLLPNPKSYSHSKFPDGLTKYANERVRKILGRMRRYKRITEGEYLMARRQLGDDVDVASDTEVLDDEEKSLPPIDQVFPESETASPSQNLEPRQQPTGPDPSQVAEPESLNEEDTEFYEPATEPADTTLEDSAEPKNQLLQNEENSIEGQPDNE